MSSCDKGDGRSAAQGENQSIWDARSTLRKPSSNAASRDDYVLNTRWAVDDEAQQND
ncbi:hypothetical protein F2Q68_00008786 [Brassica cretica]|uniref:Uncharacterized protein n=1 Tax=Brassica cretica TaxID=69181 RepID=A0A8S9L4E0_BRACR|nr:hypothetical protein F2Q68_00008786 [Brassica cretica]